MSLISWQDVLEVPEVPSARGSALEVPPTEFRGSGERKSLAAKRHLFQSRHGHQAPNLNLGMMMFFFWTRGGNSDRINGIVIEFGGVRVESCNEHVYKWHILRQLREQVGVV